MQSVTPSTQPSIQQTQNRTVRHVNAPGGSGRNPPSVKVNSAGGGGPNAPSLTPIFNKAAQKQLPQVKNAFNKAAQSTTQRAKTNAPTARPTPPKLGPGTMSNNGPQKFDIAASRDAKRQVVAKSLANAQKTAQTRTQAHTQKQGLSNTPSIKQNFNKHSRGH
ncbi:hypothetical protein PQR66_27355 [Paraburkholderia agricolaris]|uniref:Uncharacterized protein n=1 Tax=Paraburkholderia agricolaris TaxID=2152888 RepID=A0ABW8ZX45_9BURK